MAITNLATDKKNLDRRARRSTPEGRAREKAARDNRSGEQKAADKERQKRYERTPKCRASRKLQKLAYRLLPENQATEQAYRAGRSDEQLATIRANDRKCKLTPKSKASRSVGRKNADYKRRHAEGTLTDAEWETMKALYEYCCVRCGLHESVLAGGLVADHIVPTVHDGVHWAYNRQPMDRRCNSKKATKHTDYRPGFMPGSSQE